MTAPHPLRALLLLALLVTLNSTAIAVTQTATACEGVFRGRLTSAEWVVDLIRDEGGNPLTVELVALDIEPGTAVEYFDGAEWHEMTKNDEVQGEAIRHSVGGDGVFRLKTGGGCKDDWLGSQDN